MSKDFELLKDINMAEVQKWSANACYATKPKQQYSMFSASGEKIVIPENMKFVDGAAAILGNYKQEKCISGLEHFVENEQPLKKCMDGSYSARCAN